MEPKPVRKSKPWTSAAMQKLARKTETQNKKVTGLIQTETDKNKNVTLAVGMAREAMEASRKVTEIAEKYAKGNGKDTKDIRELIKSSNRIYKKVRESNARVELILKSRGGELDRLKDTVKTFTSDTLIDMNSVNKQIKKNQFRTPTSAPQAESSNELSTRSGPSFITSSLFRLHATDPTKTIKENFRKRGKKKKKQD